MFVLCKYQTGEEIKGADHLFIKMRVSDASKGIV